MPRPRMRLSHVLRLVAVVSMFASLSVVAARRAVVAAPIDAGSLSGVVQDTTGTGLGGICVSVANGPGTTTAADGSYQVDGVEAGAHTVQFVDCNPTPTFVSTWYLGRQQQDQADVVTVAANSVLVLSDVTMVEGVAVSGTVTGPSGAAAGINVSVNPYDGAGSSAGATTAVDGTYRTGPLPDGRYRVQFSDPTDALAGQYWQGSATWNGAAQLQLAISDGQEHVAVDATLSSAATISGTVTDSTGTPLADICVNANVADQGGFSNVGSGVTTAADGTYTVAGVPPAGDVRVQFRDCSATPTHLEQWFNGAADFNSANAVSLNAGEQRTGIDAQLADGIRVAGTVTDSIGNPLANINVNLNRADNNGYGYGRSGPDGHYVTSPVAPGDYRVQFTDSASPVTWATTFWDQHPTYGSATLLTLSSSDGPQRDGIDARLAAAATLSGTITDPQAHPVGNVCVTAVIDTVNGPDSPSQVSSAADGTYTLTGLPAGSYKVRVQDCNAVGPYGTI